MGVAIQCVLSRELPGRPLMEGKSLAAAFCGEAGDRRNTGPEPSNVVSLQFGHSKVQSPSPEPVSEPLLSPLDEFIAGDQGAEWHDASAGLEAVSNILEKLRSGAKVSLAPDFEFFGGDDEDLTNGVIHDLEQLEEILTGAEQVGARFYLAFSI